MELIKTGDLPLTPLGLKKMRPDLEYAGANARKLFQSDRLKAADPKRLLTTIYQKPSAKGISCLVKIWSVLSDQRKNNGL